MNAKQQPRNTCRLFIGSPPDETLRQALQSLYEARHLIKLSEGAKLRWVQPGNWHLTWLFLGDVALENTQVIQEKLQSALADSPQAEARLDNVAVWPHHNRPNALVWEVQKTPHLETINTLIRKTLPQYDDGKPFRPHITLARFGRKSPACPDLLEHELFSSTHLEWHIDTVCLYQSTLTPQGPIYDCLFRMPSA